MIDCNCYFCKCGKPHLKPGDLFDTEFETDCVFLRWCNDGTGNFVGADSDGVECSFSPRMVV